MEEKIKINVWSQAKTLLLGVAIACALICNRYIHNAFFPPLRLNRKIKATLTKYTDLQFAKNIVFHKQCYQILNNIFSHLVYPGDI